MEGTRIVLVRHGESRAQEKGFVAGHTGCEGLSDLGRRQAEALAARLAATGELAGTTALYCSLMARAAETASIIAGALGDPEPVPDCDFCEFHPGEGDGLDWADYNARWPTPVTWDIDHRRDPGSETWREMSARVARGLDRVIAAHPGGTIVIACHGGVVLQSMVRWLGLSMTGNPAQAWLDPVNTSLTEWRLGRSPHRAQRSGIQLVRYNDHAHLAQLAAVP